MHRKLMHEKRDGSLQQNRKAPLENYFLLNEQPLLGELKYTPVNLTRLAVYMVVAGAIIEAADIKADETIVIDPSDGSFGGVALEVALVLGANIILLGRNKHKLGVMKLALESPDRLQHIVMTGDVERDAAAIRELAPEDDVYINWIPANSATPLYLSAASRALEASERVVLSGGACEHVVFPHLVMLHKDLKMMGRWMYHPATAQLLIGMGIAGIFKTGKRTALRSSPSASMRITPRLRTPQRTEDGGTSWY